MYLMYVDESGDCGMLNSPTRYFCLTGIVVHELRWRDTMAQFVAFRHWLKKTFRVYLDDELHSSDMINKPSKTGDSINSLRKYERLSIIRHFANTLSTLNDISVINVVVDKALGHAKNKDQVFRWAWCTLIQRFENTIRNHNFPGPRNTDDLGIIFSDNTDGAKLRKYIKSMRFYNPLKVRQTSGAFFYKDEPIRAIIEDPIMRDSMESYFIQAADCIAYLLKQFLEPSNYMKKCGGNAYFKKLEPILCKFASNTHPLGVVML